MNIDFWRFLKRPLVYKLDSAVFNKAAPNLRESSLRATGEAIQSSTLFSGRTRLLRLWLAKTAILSNFIALIKNCGIEYKRINIGGLFFVLLMLAGCAVGPSYTPPVALVPKTWSKANNNQSEQKSSVAFWWRNFHDPVLNALIEQGSLCNLDVQSAQERVLIARKQYSLAYSQFFPKASANALPPNGTGMDLTQVMALSAVIEPDFFGKHRSNGQRAAANLAAEQAERDFILLNFQAEIAATYLEFREAQTKEKILRHNLGVNREIFTLVDSSYHSGLSNYMDIVQQKALIEVQLADLEQNSAHITMLLHKLELLTGKNPGLLAKELMPFKPVPDMKDAINLDIPANILCRRPDIVAAEKRVEAAHANIRVATAELFPKINLGWLLAWQTQTLASSIFALTEPESSFFTLFDAPLFNLSLNRVVGIREKEKALAVIQYHRAVLNALHEVETQYNYYQHFKASAQHLQKAVQQKRLVLKLAKDTYRKGSSNFNSVLRPQEELNNLEIAHLRNIIAYHITQINLYKALGGGVYEPRSDQPEKRLK